MHDGIGDDGQVSGLHRGGQRRAQAREIRAKAAPVMALRTELARRAAQFRLMIAHLGEVGDARRDDGAAREFGLDLLFEVGLYIVHPHRLQEIPVRQLRQACFRT